MQARIFTMPERYRHGAEATVLHQPETKPVVQAPVEIKAPVVPPPTPTRIPPKPIAPKKKISSTKLIVIIGVVVLLILGVGGFFLTRSVEESERPVATAPTARQAPATIEEEEEEEEEEIPSAKGGSASGGDEALEVFPTEVTPGVDTDSDGLTDTEENLVYKTNPRLPDTDSDGFLDGNEVFHRYNPSSPAPGTLLESDIVKIYSGTEGSVEYSFSYPAVWEIEQVEEALVLDAETGEGFRISFQEKDKAQGLEDWVKTYLAIDRPIVGTTKNGLTIIQSEDQLMAYIAVESLVMIFEYDTGIKARVDYLQTFQMMLNSIEATPVEL